MKILLSLVAMILGGYMCVDGIYVLSHGRYLGPEKPGPWAGLFDLIGLDVFTLGPMFIAVGIGWLIFMFSLLLKASWARLAGTIMAILTLWYLPVGTVLSILVLVLLKKGGANPAAPR